MNTSTKLLRIVTQQYSSYIYCRFQTVFSPQIIILNFMSQLKIYLQKRKRASKKKNLEHKCISQESCKNRETLAKVSSTCQGRSLRMRLSVTLFNVCDVDTTTRVLLCFQFIRCDIAMKYKENKKHLSKSKKHILFIERQDTSQLNNSGQNWQNLWFHKWYIYI